MRIAGLVLSVCLCLALPSTAGAHRMIVGAEPGAYVVTVTFDDGAPVAGAAVTVNRLDDDGLVAQGNADEHGKYCFEPPGPGVYQVTARDGAGHRDRFELVVGDETAAPAGAKPPSVGEVFYRIVSGLGYLAGFSVMAWWFLNRRAAGNPGRPKTKSERGT